MACCNGRRRVQDPLNALSPSLPSHFLAPPDKMKFRLRLLPLREQRRLRGLRKLQRMFYEQHLSMPARGGGHGRQAATNAPSGAIWCRAAVRPLREHKGSDKYKVSHQLMAHPAHRIVEDSKGLARYCRQEGWEEALRLQSGINCASIQLSLSLEY